MISTDTPAMRWIAASLLVMLGGCASARAAGAEVPEDFTSRAQDRAVVGSEEEAAQAREDGVADLQKRARFDLQCETAQVLVLERANEDGPATLVGAQGCERQAQYRRRLRRSGWTGNYTARNAGPWTRLREDGQLQTVVIAHDP